MTFLLKRFIKGLDVKDLVELAIDAIGAREAAKRIVRAVFRMDEKAREKLLARLDAFVQAVDRGNERAAATAAAEILEGIEL